MDDIKAIYDSYVKYGFSNRMSFFEYIYIFKEAQASLILDKSGDGQTFTIDTSPHIV